MIDKQKLYQDLVRSYRSQNPKSLKFFQQACRVLVQGGSHNLRLFDPFPFYDTRARGSRVRDLDGHSYIDFWQGHFANILGHNPPVVTKVMANSFQKGEGLSTGFPGIYQKELAKLILSRIKAEKIRFTTSGTLSTMYAVMMAKSFTKRALVMKAGGGWHGAHPYLLKGVTTFRGGLNEVESAGLPNGVESSTVVTRFNDPADLEAKFKESGERLACFIIEPFIGAGGFLFAKHDYLLKARELTRQYGTVLIFDEVVSGFRFHAGGIQTLYKIQPDLSVFGKAIGGGMPVSAVAGKEQIMSLCGPQARPEDKVKFEGGTFSAHPSSIRAGLAFLKYLIAHEKEIYPRIGQFGERMREGMEEIFAGQGFLVTSTGRPEAPVKSSSCVGLHFLNQDIGRIEYPDQSWNPQISDVELREKIFKLAMLLEGVNTFHGLGAISAAHTEKEIRTTLEAVERVAVKWKKYRL